ncbi:hypothetical protein EC957_000377 [Mortierella hygrophila]|uniref:Uncharacterized protein n=1 Tax=Mortierella hygrophila TaxID=979708 RepID=A0A9P6K306_9FUNG|nr:hypothetical protein EC957_000377 [Mortierella hygrophila]
MKFNNIAYLPCAILLALLFASGLVTAAPVPYRLAGSIATTQAIHITGTNQANLPALTPVFYKRLAGGRRRPFDDMKRDLSSTTTLEEEVSEPEFKNIVNLYKRVVGGGRRPFDDMKRDLSSTTTLEEVSEPEFENIVDLYKRVIRGGRRPFDDMKRDLTSTAAN